MQSSRRTFIAAACIAVAIVGCGGGGGSGGGSPLTPAPAPVGPSYTPGVFEPYTAFEQKCANPRRGANPVTGRPYNDSAGSVLYENHWLRSWTHQLYLWYSEVPDRNPAQYDNPLAYFETLKTPATTASGRPKDRFHFTYDTVEYDRMTQSGVVAGYGIHWVILQGTPPRRVVVGYVEDNSPAGNAGVLRGDEIVSIGGADAVNGNTQAIVNTLNAGLSPAAANERHTFVLRRGNATHTFELTSANVETDPVPRVATVPTTAGLVGYVLFNDHNVPAEAALSDAITTLRNANIDELVLDLRYNGGGYLVVASELGYMIAGPSSQGRTFERMIFNDQHPATNPVTGQPLTPLPFLSTTQFSTPNRALPTLNLRRVFVLTSADTCSASESIINGLRGIGFEVIQIGTTSCGKPYGFYGFDNCGTTYFSIHFGGQNEAGFGDYGDGFAPSSTSQGRLVRGCRVADDFSRELGHENEAMFAAAIHYIETNGCPAGTTPTAMQRKPVSEDAAEALILRKHPLRTNRILSQ